MNDLLFLFLAGPLVLIMLATPMFRPPARNIGRPAAVVLPEPLDMPVGPALEKARQDRLAVQQADAVWLKRHLIEAYFRTGQHDPKWDVANQELARLKPPDYEVFNGGASEE